MIRLEDVVIRYPRQHVPAVDGVTFDAAAGTITASALGVRNNGAGNITLDQANDVATFSASANGGAVTFHDTNTLAIGGVTSDPCFTATTGITTLNGSATITVDAGNLTLSNAINAGAGNVSLEATVGSILDGNDGSTTITAGDLSLTARDRIGDAIRDGHPVAGTGASR